MLFYSGEIEVALWVGNLIYHVFFDEFVLHLPQSFHLFRILIECFSEEIIIGQKPYTYVSSC
jgi:hypothetical protein